MQPLRFYIKTSLLISLAVLCAPVLAEQSGTANVKRKLAIAPGHAVVAPPVVRALPLPAQVLTKNKKQKLIKKSYPSSSFEKGLYLKQQGQINEALVQFIRAAQENPRDVRAFYEQAQLFKQVGKIKLAKSALEQSLAVAPSNTEARGLLVQLHFESGNIFGAAAEVGKLLTQHQESVAKPKSKPVDNKDAALPPPGVIHIEMAPLKNGPSPSPASDNGDDTSMWLHSAASPNSGVAASQNLKKASDSERPLQSKGGYEDVLAHIPSNAAEPEPKATAESNKTPSAVSKILNDIPGFAPSPVSESTTSPSKTAEKLAEAAAKASPGEEKEAAQGFLARMRASARNMSTSLAKPVPSWVKNHLPLAKDKEETRAEAADPSIAEDAPEQTRTQQMISWLKEKIPFLQDKPETSAFDTLPKDAKSKQVASWIKAKTQVIPFVPHAKPTSTVVKTSLDGPASGADKKGADLPPEIARALAGKFSGPTNLNATKEPEGDKDKKLQDEQIKALLSASSAEPSAPKEAHRPESSGPKYGLLNNNALSHVGASAPQDFSEQEPTMLDNLLKQAGKTFSSFLPSISWSWPTMPSIPGLKFRSNAPEAVVASVPAPEQSALPVSPGAAAASQAVPLDVSRILNKLVPSASAPSLPADQLNPRLSSSMPLAAPPANLESYIPKPLESLAAPTHGNVPQPQLRAQESNAGSGKLLLPQTQPQAAASNSAQAPAQNPLPPLVQDVLTRVEPIVKPAVAAANSLMQSIAPLAIPSQSGDRSAPSPVAVAAQALVPNNVPVPVGVNLQKYQQAEELRAEPEGSVHRLVDMQKKQAGAFTYMKPILDGDRNYLSSKQVRQIQALPGKAQEPKKSVPEDPITKRMRYLLEHGTGNMRKGEAFMFSEETGEGILFLPDGTSERRKLQDSQDAEKVLRARRPDIIKPQDLQYSLSLLGKLLPQQQQQQSQDPYAPAMNGPTLEQLMNQMNENSKGVWGWMKKSFKLN